MRPICLMCILPHWDKICEWLLLSTVIVWSGNPLTLWGGKKKQKKTLPTATMFTFQIHNNTLRLMWRHKTSTPDCSGLPTGREKSFCRVSRLNMNYPCKLYSWRVKAMTVVAQRHCTKDMDCTGWRQHNLTVISHHVKWVVIFAENLSLQGPPPRKTSTSAIDLTPHQHLVQFTRQRLAGVLWYICHTYAAIFWDIGRRIDLIRRFSLGWLCYAAFKPIRDLIIGHTYYNAQQSKIAS